jgi:transcriptional regulator with XRE-family HTH domain
VDAFNHSAYTLAACGLIVKPHAAKSHIWHLGGVPTPLQLVFANRLREELESRQLSHNGLAKAAKSRGFKLGQRTVSRILELKQDPTLSKVWEISQTLDVPIRALLGSETEPVKNPLQNVLQMPSPYPKIFGKKTQSESGKTKSGVKNGRTGQKTPNRK